MLQYYYLLMYQILKESSDYGQMLKFIVQKNWGKKFFFLVKSENLKLLHVNNILGFSLMIKT